MAKGTPATVALTKAGVTFKLHEYDYDPNAARIGRLIHGSAGVSAGHVPSFRPARTKTSNR